jgi:hypothetical protein
LGSEISATSFSTALRVLHYIEHFDYRDELFIFGGIPGPYQELVGQALCEAARIPVSSLYFPDRGLLLSGARKCIWFSDQKELHSHPAQMAHPQSLRACLAKFLLPRQPPVRVAAVKPGSHDFG